MIITFYPSILAPLKESIQYSIMQYSVRTLPLLNNNMTLLMNNMALRVDNMPLSEGMKILQILMKKVAEIFGRLKNILYLCNVIK